ncbi:MULTISPECIES: hypothetical protein [unclassified Micromonospora]|uniref:hypothetical protein n=1 Tax=unclassified Micromonospora TaxID=2617518 RepID=UPI0020B3398A|nr:MULTISPECIES: hypothetical protein [unclassified Micromonospora]MDM4784647.1 hypothetical protein [Micromonospora sp. b486]
MPFPSVRVDAGTIIDLVRGEPGGSNVDHFCLVVEPVDWQRVVGSGVFTVLTARFRASARAAPPPRST